MGLKEFKAKQYGEMDVMESILGVEVYIILEDKFFDSIYFISFWIILFLRITRIQQTQETNSTRQL